MKRILFILILCVAVAIGLASGGATATAEAMLRPGYSGQIVHVVRWGDTVNGIADMYGTSPILIINANRLRNPNHLVVGARLTVPVHNYVSPGWTAPVPVVPVSAPAPAPAPGGCIPYTIQPGDSVAGIAAKFGVSQASLIQINNLINPNYIHAGVTIRVCDVVAAPPAQVVIVPAPQVVVQPVVIAPPPPPPPGPPPCNARYTVQRNDTLFSIATWYNTSVQSLRDANNLGADAIYVGQVLVVPCGVSTKPAPRPEPKPLPPQIIEHPKPDLRPAVCNPAVSLSYPRQGEHVSGIIDIVGTATIPNFQFYKVEYGQGVAPFNFVSIGDVVRNAKTGTTLVTWDTTTVPDGEYVLRLTAVENSGQFPTPCNVRIVVDN